jgi:sulfur dioxygenase
MPVQKTKQSSAKLIFHQLFEKETSTYTYLLADPLTREAVLIDSVLEMAERDEKLIAELDLKLILILDTHIHADHVTAAGLHRDRVAGAKSGVSFEAKVGCADLAITDGQELRFGSYVIKAMTTPGHTDSCMCYVLDDMVFTGDTLLIRGCGRTDFQQGSAETLFASVREKLFALPDETLVYPGHDYRGLTHSTIGAEKTHNPRLKLSNDKATFVKIMTELKLDLPKKIAEAVPMNLECGRKAPLV